MYTSSPLPFHSRTQKNPFNRSQISPNSSFVSSIHPFSDLGLSLFSMDSSLTLSLSNTKSDTNNLIGTYFLEQWRLKSKAAARKSESVMGVSETQFLMEIDSEGCEEEKEELPTELDTLNSSGGFSIVGSDKLSVRYPSVNLHGHDVGVVQANRHAPCKRLVYYFEMFVENAGSKGQVAIGFTTPGFKLRRQPGWESNSYGYHGDDGLLYRGQGNGEVFGPVYSTGDTVGGGINYASQELFFTKNGTVVGTVFKDVKGPLFPTVAVHSQNEVITVNFGKRPFVFDLKAYEAQERAKQYSTIEKLSIPQNASYGGGIIGDFLSHLMCCCCALVQELREVEIRGANGTEKTKTSPPPSQFMET